MAPDMHAPVEYLKQPGVLATTVTDRSEPPMTVPGGSNGDDVPKSITNPVFLDSLCHVTLVPALTQNNALSLASGMLAFAAAESAVRFTSTVHEVDDEPQVLFTPHIFSG